MRRFFTVLFCLLSWPLVAATEQYTLSNGLKIIVQEDHRAPVAVSVLWYDVGSADEPGGITGISHALEHLMFKGTPKYPMGVYSKLIASIGGQENAMTSKDYTAYYVKIAAGNLEKTLELEADRLQNLQIKADEFAKEMKVIQEERRMRTDDNPQSLAFERLLATANLAAPYQHPVIGWMSDIQQLTVDDARRWFHSFYAPNNATLVVVGDIKGEAVRTLAERYFGHIPTKPKLVRKAQLEPPNLGPKKIVVRAPAQVPILMLAYTVPTLKSATKSTTVNPYVLEVLAGILAEGNDGRLNQNLVRGQHIASAADDYFDLYARYQTQFVLFASPSQGHTLNELKKSMLHEINALAATSVSPEELQRVKTQLIAQKTFERDSIFNQAMELGILETIGLGWKTSLKYADEINRITPAMLQEAVKTYFSPERLTEAQLIPIQPPKGNS